MNAQGSSQDSGNGLALSYRLTTVEEEVRGLRAQFDRYETTRESNLKLDQIRDTLRRIESDVTDIKQQMIVQEKASKERDVEQQQGQSRLQIRVLYTTLSVIGGVFVTIITALIIYFLTHLP
jgi:hypothetical protein